MHFALINYETLVAKNSIFMGFWFNLNRELARDLREKGVTDLADVEDVIQKSKSISRTYVSVW